MTNTEAVEAVAKAIIDEACRLLKSQRGGWLGQKLEAAKEVALASLKERT